MSALNLHVTVPPERELSRGGGEEWEAAAEGGGVQSDGTLGSKELPVSTS